MPNKNFAASRKAAPATVAPVPESKGQIINLDLKVVFQQMAFNRDKDESLEMLTEFYEVYIRSDANNQTEFDDKIEQARFFIDMVNLLEVVYSEFKE